MQAVVMTAPGGPEVLRMQAVADPVIQRDTEVLVRLKAAGINPIDTKIRSKASAFPVRLPAVLGCDGAGVVEAVGGGVRDFKVGDEVYFCRCGFGACPGNYAQYAVVDQRLVAMKPASLSFAEAAAAPLALITAWESLFDRARLEPGQQALIHGGAGGVGHLAIQLAKHAGARVCTTVGSEDKAAFAERLGAEEPILYKDENFVLAILAWTDEQGVDVALDTVGGETFEHSFTAVRCYGDLVTLLQPAANTNWMIARQRNLRISLELMLTPIYLGMEDAQRHQGEILRRCAGLFDNGELRVHVAQSFPLAEAAAAHRVLESGSMSGKLALVID